MATLSYQSLRDFKGKRVTVMGLGLSGGGVGAVRFLVGAGADVTVTDLRTREELKPSLDALADLSVTYHFGSHRNEDFTDTDLVIKNPAVPADSPYLVLARNAGVSIDTEVGIFMELTPAPVLGVTGTKGKTTTATLLTEILRRSTPKTVLAGNVRVSPLGELAQLTPETPVVLELSSFQLENFDEHQVSPRIAVVTNIYEDHLDRYDSLADYAAAKENIFRFQKAGDTLILNQDDAWTEKFEETYRAAKSKATLLYVSATGRVQQGADVRGEYVYWVPPEGEPKEVMAIGEIPLPGEHNVTNVLAAVAAAKAFGVATADVRAAVRSFTGVENRLELVRAVSEVNYYNDTTATIPEATIAALSALAEPVVLIAGGSEKNVTYKDLALSIVQNAKSLVLLNDAASPRIEEAVEHIEDDFPISYAESMEEAVAQAAAAAVAGDVVLLSPAAASFGLFLNEFDRGEQFVAAVKKLP